MAYDVVLQRRAHLPVGPGPAERGWSGYVRQHMDGPTRSVSTYDADFGASESNVWKRIFSGILSRGERLPLSAPTLTRRGLVSAQLSSLPNAVFFQSYTGAGTGSNFSPLAGSAVVGHTPLTKDMNLNAQGAAELHPATTYDPFPAPGDLFPKVV